jgi:16S rRNA (adenine1518-N6/adenine1519-N6)-dimethyltransferase
MRHACSGRLVTTVTDLGPQGRSRIRELLDSYELSPRKSLGQNFLADPNVIRKIVRIAGIDSGSRVVEIGGGTGTLTEALAATGASVVVYEIDDGLVEVLGGVVGDLPNVEVRHEDAARVDLEQALVGGPWTLVANLPYNVGTGILLDAIRGAPRVTRFVAMVQREVADRLFAEAGSKTYGVPSVVIALYTAGGPEFNVGPDVFYPKPPVGSTVVVLDRIEPPEKAEQAVSIAAVAFQQRRKMLRKSLESVLDDPAPALLSAGIDPTARAEDLQPLDFITLAEVMDR